MKEKSKFPERNGALRKKREQDPEYIKRIKARAAARVAFPVSQPCSVCGTDNAHRHHEDYDKPLDITWLCHSCHKQHHASLHRESGKPVVMKQVTMNITEGLLAVLREMEKKERFGPLIERLLRKHPKVEAERQRRGIVFPDRPTPGNRQLKLSGKRAKKQEGDK